MRTDARVEAAAARRSFSCTFAAMAIAAVIWLALAIDATHAVASQLARGSTWPAAIFGYLRFFTIETNLGVAVLMSAAAWSRCLGQAGPDASWFRAATAYMIVTGVTYELLLRQLWSPRGVQFATDLVFHDVAPTATVLFWLACAPKRSLTQGGVPALLLFPAVYFAGTLAAGAAGAGYPYGFLDADRLGYPTAIAIGLVFLAVFYALGAGLTFLAARITGDRSRAGDRRPSS